MRVYVSGSVQFDLVAYVTVVVQPHSLRPSLSDPVESVEERCAAVRSCFTLLAALHNLKGSSLTHSLTSTHKDEATVLLKPLIILNLP